MDVVAFTRALVDIEAEDTAVVTLRFRNGALGIIEATTAARPKDLRVSNCSFHRPALGRNGNSRRVRVRGMLPHDPRVRPRRTVCATTPPGLR